MLFKLGPWNETFDRFAAPGGIHDADRNTEILMQRASEEIGHGGLPASIRRAVDLPGSCLLTLRQWLWGISFVDSEYANVVRRPGLDNRPNRGNLTGTSVERHLHVRLSARVPDLANKHVAKLIYLFS